MIYVDLGLVMLICDTDRIPNPYINEPEIFLETQVTAGTAIILCVQRKILIDLGRFYCTEIVCFLSMECYI